MRAEHRRKEQSGREKVASLIDQEAVNKWGLRMLKMVQIRCCETSGR